MIENTNNAPIFKAIKPATSKLDTHLDVKGLEKVINKAHENYREKTYLEENLPLYMFCGYASKFGGVLSILAAFLFILDLFLQITAGTPLSKTESKPLIAILGIISFSFLLMIEYAKSTLLSNLAKTKQKRGKINTGFAVALIVCLASSAYTSIQGSNNLAVMNAQPDEKSIIKVDSVGNNYDSQIKEMQKQITAAPKNGSGYSWNGVLTEKGRKYVEKLQSNIMKLQELKDKNVESSRNANNTTIQAANDKGAYNGAIVMLISFFIEALIIATILYCERYEFVALQENEMLLATTQRHNDTKPVTRNRNDLAATNHNDITTQRPAKIAAQKIGFSNEQATTSLANCEQCGNEFEPKNRVHKFCSNECRYEYHEERTGVSINKLKRKSS